MACLASVLEVRGTQLANLDNCEHSLKIINSIVNRSGVVAQQLDLGPPEDSDGDGAVIAGGGGRSPKSPKPAASSSTPGSKSPSPAVGATASVVTPMSGTGTASATPATTPMLNRTLTFDHGRCTDCSYGYLKTCDCTSHLNAIQKQSLDANDRLQQLVEMRERVFEEAEKLIAAQGLDPSMLGAGAKSGSGSSFSEMFASPASKKGDSPSAASASPLPFSPTEKDRGTAAGTPAGGKAVASAIASEGIATERDDTWKDCDGTEVDSANDPAAPSSA